MSTTDIMIVVVAVLVVASLIIAPLFARRNRGKKLQSQFGTEYEATVKSMGGEKQAQTELEARQKHVKTLNIRDLTIQERDRYQIEWNAIQTKFVDEPGQAIINAAQEIIEVMQIRDFPISDFDQRAADISVMYPNFVSNYRAARVIAVKNEEKKASTEELRQAMIYYRSLFDQLLGKAHLAVEEV